MKKRITFKQAMFLMPLLILLGIFAVYPIATSAVYSLFDYRTNDQSAAGLYVSSKFNAPLFYEDAGYITWYMEDDVTLLEGNDLTAAQAIIDGINEIAAPYEGVSEVVSIDDDIAQSVLDKMDAYQNELKTIYANNSSKEFYNGYEKLSLLFDEIKTCKISSNFTGLAAYKQVLQDTRFGTSLGTTITFTVISVFFEFVLGLALALIMNKAIKGIGIVRTVSLIPWAIPTAVSALMWSYMYDGSYGVVAKIFTDLGFISSPEVMLLSKSGAMAAAILADVWKTTPYMALLLLAGLQVIDKGLYESASIDGAGPIKTFFSITLPLLKPSILVALLFRTLDAFRVYDLIAVLTGGAQGTETLSIYAYKLMINQSNYGYGSVVVLAMAACVGIISFIFVKVLGAELLEDD
ncbi:MAG: sugar ABC transporter permease [Firmicutes bacterium]|nr:sugar ABC transporter permease [Candidatus Colivicinus equi]